MGRAWDPGRPIRSRVRLSRRRNLTLPGRGPLQLLCAARCGPGPERRRRRQAPDSDGGCCKPECRGGGRGAADRLRAGNELGRRWRVRARGPGPGLLRRIRTPPLGPGSGWPGPVRRRGQRRGSPPEMVRTPGTALTQSVSLHCQSRSRSGGAAAAAPAPCRSVTPSQC